MKENKLLEPIISAWEQSISNYQYIMMKNYMDLLTYKRDGILGKMWQTINCFEIKKKLQLSSYIWGVSKGAHYFPSEPTF